MMIVNIDAGEDNNHYVAKVYQEQYARLRRYFLIQLGDGPEAERCIQETMRRFFFFMEDRDWEAEAEYIPVYLMRIAGMLCSRRLCEKGPKRARSRGEGGEGPFNKVRAEVVRAVKERIEFMKIFLRLTGHGGGHPSSV
jgi:hypothetical protein